MLSHFQVFSTCGEIIEVRMMTDQNGKSKVLILFYLHLLYAFQYVLLFFFFFFLIESLFYSVEFLFHCHRDIALYVSQQKRLLTRL